MEEAEYYINRLGGAFEDISYTSILDKQGNVAVEALTQSIVQLDEATYGADNGVVQMLETLQGGVSDVYEAYVALTDLRGQLSLVGLNAKYLTSQMLLGAGGLNELSDAMGQFYGLYLTDTERLSYETDKVVKSFTDLGLTLPIGEAGFRDLIESLDISTESGQELYGRLILLSESFSSMTDSSNALLSAQRDNMLELDALQRQFIEEQKQGLTDALTAVINLSKAFQEMENSLSDTIATLLGGVNGTASSRQLISQFWEKRAELDALFAKNGDLSTEEQTRLQGLIGDISSLSTNIQGATVGDKTSITGSIVGALKGIQDELNFDDVILQARIVDAGGNDILVSTEGSLTALTRAMVEYNEALLAQTTANSTLTFTDFRAGGILATQDEIAFRQSFQADSALTFQDELGQLRSNLAFMSLESTDIAAFLGELAGADSTGLGNVVEFFTSLGEIPATVVEAFDVMRESLDAQIDSLYGQIATEEQLTKTNIALASGRIDAAMNAYGTAYSASATAAMANIPLPKLTGDAATDAWLTSVNTTGNLALDKITAATNSADIQKALASLTLWEKTLLSYTNLDETYISSVSAKEVAWATAVNTLNTENAYIESQQSLGASTIASIRVQLDTLESQYTALPSFAVGSAYLPNDMVANVHRGEIIMDRASSDVLRKYGIPTNDYLTPVMERMYGKLEEMAGYMKRMDDNIDGAMRGRSLQVTMV
jgi:hypothetical protein